MTSSNSPDGDSQFPEHIQLSLRQLSERGENTELVRERFRTMVANGYDPQHLVITPRGSVILDPMKVEADARRRR